MNKPKQALLLTLLMIVSLALEGRDKDQMVSVLSTKRDIFYFKVSTAFCGASIEVFGPDGTLIMTDKMTHHKGLIDFYYENPGHYTIKMTKGDQTREYAYDKASPSPFRQVEVSHRVSLNQ